MKRFATLLLAASFFVTALGAPAMAKTTKMTKTKTAAVMKCPVCGMPLTTHKTAMNTYPVKIKGKTYYCCAMCAKQMAKMNKKSK